MVLATETLIGDIYDCAASPDRWPETLGRLRDRFEGAYVLIGFADLSPPPSGQPIGSIASRNISLHSPWDSEYIRKAGEYLGDYPGAENFILKEADQGWSQMSVINEPDFRQTRFYNNFCKPQALRDCLNAVIIKRPEMMCGIAITRGDGTQLFDADDTALAESLTPHLRRALAINDVTDKGRLAMVLFRSMLDKLATAVFLIGHAGKIEFSNAMAEDLLSTGQLLMRRGGALIATQPASTGALESALVRAAQGDASIGMSGIGVPLVGADGTRAAAYVLPMGKSEIRNEMGRGHCAVFVALRGEQLPVITEIMRTLFGLTPTEAKISTLIAKGDKPVDIADAMDLSVNTVRTHLARAFSKTNTNDQTGLANVIRQLSPPLAI